jgi:REP element-mobilizing transposase RayT
MPDFSVKGHIEHFIHCHNNLIEMANTYSTLYIHIVFAVKGRANLMKKSWREDLYKYITGIVSSKGQKMMAVNGVEDHIHILVSITPSCNMSDLVRDIKANSSKWVNEKRFVASKFEWQTGFGAFSVGTSNLDMMVKYILNQENHHRIKTFKTEYVGLLNAYQIDFKADYIFDDYGVAPTGLGAG